MSNDPATLDVPVAELDDTDHRSDELLRDFSHLLETSPETVEKWLRDAAQPSVVRRLQRFCNESRPAPTSLDVLRCSPKRAASVTSELFQQWLVAGPSATGSPLQSVSPVARTTANGCSAQRQRQLAGLADGELFMELIRDVANELDIDVLCHKILVNVGLLTQADRGSLFLAHTDRDEGVRYLEAKLFDVTEETVAEEAIRRARDEPIRIPFGVGIAGTVAATKETINIADAYADERFSREVDQRTGYRTKMILSMPICNYEGTVIGVAQIINKRSSSTKSEDGTAVGFSEKDVEVFGRYLTFCGIGIQNAQLFEVSVQEYRRNQILLHLARSIFEEQNNLECLVTKILLEARALLKCERCTVYLVDLDCCESSHLQKIVEKPAAAHAHPPLSRRQSHNVNVEDILAQQKSQANFTMLFDLAAQQEVATAQRPTLEEFADSTLCQIAQFVANEARLRNIDSLHEWLNDSTTVERKSLRATDSERVCSSVQSLLCMPIVNGQNKVIGAVQLINKDGDRPFAEQDVVMLEAFAIFCGLGIHNTQMYENACKLMAKQKVALECLSYHATATNMQTSRLVQDTIQSAEAYALYSFKFVDFELSEDDTCRATVRMFLQCNLVQQFHIPYDVLCRWILSIRKNYRPLKYHNWRHALNVTQTMFAMMKTGKMERFVTDLEILGLLVACLCHDLDHRGTNNAFQSKTDSPLAILYTTSTMEHHHFDQCVMILNSEGNNIFQALSPEDYRRVMKIVEAAILSTDLATYFKKRNEFVHLVDNGEFDWQSEDKKELLCGMMMTACDVSAIAKPWEVQHRVAKLVADEFFDQGDMEKFQLNMQPVAMMDRERKDELPKMQVGFIDLICVPLYRMLSDTFPWIRPLYDGTMDNRQHWQDLAEKVEMGLTWIDHDTIDKPVEEFAAHPEEIADIEFTVTSLNCTPHHAGGSASSDRSTPPPPPHPASGGNSAPGTATAPPSRRQRFSSLRKTGALTKVMRSRLSRSFYSSHCDRGGATSDPRRSQDSTTCSVTAKIRQLSLSQAAESAACTVADDGGAPAAKCCGERAQKMAAPCVIGQPPTPSVEKQGAKMAATVTASSSSSRIKKRSSRLCVAL